MTKDMSWRQFVAAAARNDFDVRMIWLADRSVPNGANYGMVFDIARRKIDRRASLAYAIERRTADLAKARA